MTMTDKRFFQLSPTGAATTRLEEAESFFLAGNLNEALAAAQQAWREHPQEPDVFRVLAYIHMARGEYPPAAQAAYQSVVVDGENPASYAILAQVYLTFNMLGNADDTLTAALQRFPEDPALLVLTADIRFRQRKDDAATMLAVRALKLNPQDGYAKALLGTYRLQKKLYADAQAFLSAAVVVYPQRWDYLRDLGIAQLQTGAYAEALPTLAQSFRLNPSDPRTAHHLTYALKLAIPSPYWRTSFYFFNRPWLGWLLNIFGLVTVLIGLIQGTVALVQQDDLPQALLLPSLLLLGGIALVILTQSGITMRMRKGKSFLLYLWKAIDKL